MSSSTESLGETFATFLAVVGGIIGLGVGVDDPAISAFGALIVGVVAGGIAGYITAAVLNLVALVVIGAVGVLIAINRFMFIIEWLDSL